MGVYCIRKEFAPRAANSSLYELTPTEKDDKSRKGASSASPVILILFVRDILAEADLLPFKL